MINNRQARNYRKSAIISLFVIQILFFFGQGKIVAQEIETISINNLRKHIEFIASDATEGRFTGSPGYKKAAQYAADVFQQAGLNPGYTNEKGEKSYFQPVPFVRSNYAHTSIILRKNGNNKTFAHSASNFVILNLGTAYENIPMASPAFIGYGIHELELGWDDYAGVDVAGKWVIVLNGMPPADANNPPFPDSLRKIYADWKTHDSRKLAALTRHKAAGLIVLPDQNATDNWENAVLSNYRFNYIHYAGVDMNEEEPSESVLPVILVHPELAQNIFTGQSYAPGRFSRLSLSTERAFS